MSFIYRDYNAPRIGIHNSKVMRKSLFAKVHPKIIVDGVEVFGTCQIYQDSAKVTSDPTFKRFLRSMGTSYKELNAQILGTENIDKVENIYFKMDQSKLTFTPKTKAYTVTKLNADYLYDMSVPFVNTASVYYYSQGRVVDEIVATLPSNTNIKLYQFITTTGVSSTSEDGNFNISSNGVITITASGILTTANKVDYTNPFRVDPAYTIKATILDNTTINLPITMIVKRDYVDVQISVGGQYTNTVVGSPSVDSGVPNMFTNLPLLRTTIENNAMRYLAGVYPLDDISDVSTYTTDTINIVGGGSLSMKVADISYNEDWGTNLDTLAVLDDETIFECTIPAMSEVIELTPIGVQRNGTYTTLYNMSYTYTKRYKVKAVAAETSILISNIDTIAKLFIPTNIAVSYWRRTILNSVNRSAMDTTIKDTVKDLQTDYYYEDNAIFYRGLLRVSAFNAMTANEFHTVFTKCFTTDFTKKKVKWWKKVLAIIIVIIAVIIIILSVMFPPFAIEGTAFAQMLFTVAVALSIGLAFLTLSGMIYAKNVGDETGMKIIAGAAQVVGIALAIVAIIYSYQNIMQGSGGLTAIGEMTAEQIIAAGGTAAVYDIMLSILFDTIIAGLTLAVGVASFGVNVLGMGGEKEQQIINTAAAVLGAYQGFSNFTAGFSAPSVGPVQNVTNFVTMAESGFRAYMAINAIGTHTDSTGSAEQAIPENGVESVFLLESRTVSFDAIEALDHRMLLEYGVNRTNAIKQNQYL